MIHDWTRCTFGYLQKAKPKPQSLSRSHIRDLGFIKKKKKRKNENRSKNNFNNLNT